MTPNPPTGPEPDDPTHNPYSTLDGIHGTDTKSMPIVKPAGELGPPNTAEDGGTDWVEAVPGKRRVDS